MNYRIFRRLSLPVGERQGGFKISKRNPNNIGKDPRLVHSPKRQLRLHEVLVEADDYSLATGQWRAHDGTWRPVLLSRWNGWDGNIGSLSSYGRHALWFVIPDQLYPMFLTSDFSPIPEAEREQVSDFLFTTPYKGDDRIIATMEDSEDAAVCEACAMDMKLQDFHARRLALAAARRDMDKFRS